MKKVVYYARVSTQEEKQVNALKKQIEDCKRCINNNDDWILVDEYVDKGKSGTTTKHRNEYKRLYNDLLTDKFDIVVVTHLDRLIRKPLTWYLFADRLLKQKKQIYFALENKFYKPSDELITGIKAAVAAQYSRDLSNKISNAHRRRQEQGKPLINSRMWGYDVLDNGEIVINEREAKIVEQIFDLYIAGNGFRKIQQKLTEQGIYNKNGNEFSLTTLKRIIKNEKYKGVLISNKKHKDFDTKQIIDNPKEEWIIKKDAFPAIISEEKWELANDILNKRKKTYKNDETAKKIIAGYFKGKYLYSGKIICGKCGKTYWHQTYGAKHNKSLWQCSTYRKYGKNTKNGCDNPHIRTEELDTIIKEIIFDFWSNRENNIQQVINVIDKCLKKNNYNETIKKLTENKIKIKRKKESLIELYAEQLITKKEFKEKNEKYNLELEEINKKINLFEEKNKQLIDKKQRMLEIKNKLKKDYSSKDNLDEHIIENFLKQIKVISDSKLEITLNGDFNFIAQKIDGEFVYENVAESR